MLLQQNVRPNGLGSFNSKGGKVEKAQEILQRVTCIIFCGSVDGTLTTAAVYRNIHHECLLIPCMPYILDTVRVEHYKINKQQRKKYNILFVNLAAMGGDNLATVNFLMYVKDNGHEIIGILDEHNAQRWEAAFKASGLPFDNLAIKPVTRDIGDIKSSGALFLSLFGNEVDEYTIELCKAADAADHGDFSTHFGNLVNMALKSRLSFDSRRKYLVRHFSKHRTPDKKIELWIKNYSPIMNTHQEIIETGKDLGNGVFRINCVDKRIDKTTLFKMINELGFKVILMEKDLYNSDLNKAIRQIMIACKNEVGLNLAKIMKSKSIKYFGDNSKLNPRVNISLIDEKKAIKAIRPYLVLKTN